MFGRLHCYEVTFVRKCNTEIRTFRNQMRVKCKLKVAEWVNQLESCEEKGGVEGPVSLHYLDPSTILQDLTWGTDSQLYQKIYFP